MINQCPTILDFNLVAFLGLLGLLFSFFSLLFSFFAPGDEEGEISSLRFKGYIHKSNKKKKAHVDTFLPSLENSQNKCHIPINYCTKMS